MRVLLLEAGGRDRSPNIKIPAAFAKQFHTKLDWDFDTEPEPHCRRPIALHPARQGLGGSSSMNAMLYVRGRPLDYDALGGLRARPAGAGGRAAVLSCAPRTTRAAPRSSTAVGGPLRVADDARHARCRPALIVAASGRRDPVIDDYNGPEQDGVSMFQVTQSGGRRFSSADAYPAPRARTAPTSRCAPARTCSVSSSTARAPAGCAPRPARRRSVAARRARGAACARAPSGRPAPAALGDRRHR